jgi:hypothetical protein
VVIDLALGIAVVFTVALVGFIARAIRPPRVCHYCGRPEPPRRLRKIELSGSGLVEVCRDATACRTRHQRALAR